MGQDAECCPFCRERIKGFMGLYAKGGPKGKPGAAEAAAGAAAPRRDTQSVKIRSKEEQWLASITAALKAKDGTPVEYGILSNPNFGGVPRPDGVNIKLGDLLHKHAAEWGFILTQRGTTKYVALARTPGKPRPGACPDKKDKPRPRQPGDWDCPSCGNLVFAGKERCLRKFSGGRVCGAKMPENVQADIHRRMTPNATFSSSRQLEGKRVEESCSEFNQEQRKRKRGSMGINDICTIRK